MAEIGAYEVELKNKYIPVIASCTVSAETILEFIEVCHSYGINPTITNIHYFS